MARSANQKLKLLYLMRYLLRNSDENHPVTVRQMGEYLRGQGISAERKSLYDDIEALQQFGLDIIQVKDGNFYGYYVGSRDFQLPEAQAARRQRAVLEVHHAQKDALADREDRAARQRA